MAKAQYSKPTSQLDLEARQKADYVPPAVLVQGTDPALSDNGYVGVDPIYHNAANDTEKPMQADGGAEAKIFENFVDEAVKYPELDSADEGEDEDEKSSTPPSGSSTPNNS